MKKKFKIFALATMLVALASCGGKETETSAPEKVQEEMSAEDAALEKEFEKLDEDVQTIEDTLKK